MKKVCALLSLSIVMLLLLSSVPGSSMAADEQIVHEPLEKEYTHTVFVEAGTAAFCSPCATAAEQMNTIYNGGQYQYEYVALVSDRNDYVNARLTELDVQYIPDYHFDGSYTNHVGSGSLPGAYTSRLDECGARSVADIDLALQVLWIGDAELEINLDVINNDGSSYDGWLRIVVAEEVSRWNTAGGNPYHHAMIGDYAFSAMIDVNGGSTEPISVTWDGDQYGFGDIVQSNIMVMAAVYNGGSLGYVDESIMARAIEETNEPPATPAAPGGPSDGEVGLPIEFTASTTDPDEDQLYYMFDWGDGTASSWLGPYDSGVSVADLHAFNQPGSYLVRVKARDINEEITPWSEGLTVTIRAGPDIQIREMTGSIDGVSSSIWNTGGLPAEDIEWSLEVTGGFLFGSPNTNGTVTTLAAGDTVDIASGRVIGFGAISVTITAEDDRGDTDSRTETGKVFIIWVKLGS